MAIIQATAYWAKVLGKPRPNKFNPENPEWSIEAGNLDADTQKMLRKEGLAARLKDKDDERGVFITFKRKKFTFKGDENDPIRVKDSDGNDWPQNVLIGNGSKVLIKFNARENPTTKQVNAYIQAIKVTELVEYEVDDFEGWNDDGDTEADKVGRAIKLVRGKVNDQWESDDEVGEKPAPKPTKRKAPVDEDLDDDVPF